VGLIRTRLFSWVALALFATGSWATPAAPQDKARASAAVHNEDSRLMELFRADKRRLDALDPLAAIHRDDAAGRAAFDLLFTDELDRRTLATARLALAELRSIDRARLSPERQISYDAFVYDKREAEAWLQPEVRRLTAVRPINHFGGFHVEFPAMIAQGGAVPYRTEADYRRNLEIMRAFPAVSDRIVLRFRQGMQSGVLDTQVTVRNMIAQIDAILAQNTEQTPFLSPLRAFPAEVPRRSRKALRRSYAAAVTAEVYPAYRRLRSFLADEYLPAARTNVGLSAMPGGAALYRLTIARETTRALDPDAIHQLGLSEVTRIQREMEVVARQLGYQGTLRGFFQHLRTDPQFHPRGPSELGDGFTVVARKVEALAPRYFMRMPRTPLRIEPYPRYLERFEAGGSYEEGGAGSTRGGVFFYNTYDWPSRFLTGIATLYLHEGAPGHHFQISLAQENTDLPDFQRFGGNSAFVEGWALYAETLGFAMGLYDDPLQHWGTLDDEMLRAMRLVVDTGLHAKDWSREQAVAYMLENSGMGRSDAEAEVDRYIAWPAQALSYKIGALTIQRLRKDAEQRLGSRFDLREFHDQVLGSGALPLPILEAKIERWIAGKP